MFQTFLKGLPSNFKTPIVVTQHIAQHHLTDLIAVFDGTGGRRVFAARHGQRLENNTVYVASESRHLLLDRVDGSLQVHQSDGPEENFCRPSVDPMFRSVAENCGRAAVGVILTGMGTDGAIGSVALRKKGAPVVVQDKESSVVWGMPGAVVQRGAASIVVSGEKIAPVVCQLVR
jgi:two-component system chemotaxis response regulator CheB